MLFRALTRTRPHAHPDATEHSTPDRPPAPPVALRPRDPHRPHRPRRWAKHAAAHAVMVLLLLSTPAAAYADSHPDMVVFAANTLPVVIRNLQTWVMGILAALATLFLVLAGVYWATAGGDPAQVDKAKGALKNALIGYGLAVLAPVLLQVVKGIVGG
jgi:hypothetical protein